MLPPWRVIWDRPGWNPKEKRVSTPAMDRRQDGLTDVEQAAERLARPRARAELAAKRALDVVLALTVFVALMPLFVVVALLLGLAGGRWTEQRVRLGRNGRALVLLRFRELPGGAVGRALGRAGIRELPLLLAILRGQLSFVGPRALPPGTDAGHTGPRRLMAPGLLGPGHRGDVSDTELDDAYVARWSLWSDIRLLVSRSPGVHQSVSKSIS
jgi:lipopolysaccharide/colanic/teichoic acid biosynthesis glycosyltransferase